MMFYCLKAEGKGFPSPSKYQFDSSEKVCCQLAFQAAKGTMVIIPSNIGFCMVGLFENLEIILKYKTNVILPCTEI